MKTTVGLFRGECEQQVDEPMQSPWIARSEHSRDRRAPILHRIGRDRLETTGQAWTQPLPHRRQLRERPEFAPVQQAGDDLGRKALFALLNTQGYSNPLGKRTFVLLKSRSSKGRKVGKRMSL